jgi:Skp family chaperone for outer membrane proteins
MAWFFQIKNEMIKKVILLIFIASGLLNAQKPQTIAYIDMEYILESIPAYEEAQRKLETKVSQWRQNIEKKEGVIEKLKSDLADEKILLTDDLIIERKEDIHIKEVELKKLQARYFGVEGSLFEMRQQLVQPIQDEVYNAIQIIVKKKRYDFVIDRSSDLIILHANKKYDISKSVIAYITKSKKEIEIEEAKIKKKKSKDALQKRIEAQKARRAKKESKIIHR